MSMMLAPPIIVFIKDAWPGQSTRVNWMKSRESGIECFKRNQEGMRMMKAEKPRSSVIPRAYDCGFLSNPAVDAIVDRALHREVFPESICPRIPRLMLRILAGFDKSADELSILSIVNVDSTIIIN